MQSNGKKLSAKVVLIAAIAVILTVSVATAGFLSFDIGNPNDADNNPQTSTPTPLQSNAPVEDSPTDTPQPAATSSTSQSSSSDSGDSSSSPVTSNGVLAYSDSGCTQPLTSIQWGTIAAGSYVERTIYLKNPQSTALTLSLSTSNWNPAGAANFITITWNRQNQVIDGGQSMTATVRLTVASTVSSNSDFSVKIVMTGN